MPLPEVKGKVKVISESLYFTIIMECWCTVSPIHFPPRAAVNIRETADYVSEHTRMTENDVSECACTQTHAQ